ncbi:hypothetical protein LCGC14_1408400 [marine sediment metagenome]|uniref:Uncharacterized protein n=1 Tax=marine sediment metagenome TaxID=412755 RepID=A0A0F9KFX6_9ZZZZ
MLKRREFLTSICGLGIAALAPWALLAGTKWQRNEITWAKIKSKITDPIKNRIENVVADITIIPFDCDLHRFGDSDGFGDGLWVAT